MQEGVIALAALLRHLRFDFTGVQPPQPVQKITVQPADGIRMRVMQR
jgi:cytochrome P450